MPIKKKKKATKKKTVKKKTTTKKAKPTKKKVAKKKTKTVKKTVKKKTAAPKKKKKKTVKKKSATTKKKTTTKKAKSPVKKVAKKPAKTKTPVSKKKAAPKKAVSKPKKPRKKAASSTLEVAPPPTNHTEQERRFESSMEKEKVIPEPLIREEQEEDIIEVEPIVADDDYMTDEQLDHFRRLLLQWKEQLMQEVDSTVGHLQEDATSYPDPIDRASQEEGFNLELRTRDRERKLIKKIEQALDSIETGDYGFCEDCGAEIGARRLEARPTATKCIDCKTFEEIREKQAGN